VGAGRLDGTSSARCDVDQVSGMPVICMEEARDLIFPHHENEIAQAEVPLFPRPCDAIGGLSCDGILLKMSKFWEIAVLGTRFARTLSC